MTDLWLPAGESQSSSNRHAFVTRVVADLRYTTIPPCPGKSLSSFQRMARKKKKFEQLARLPYERVVTGATLADGLRALVNGLFGSKPPYRPTLQQIADYYLTSREREIAYLAALGIPDKDIADALGMNFQTVRQHLRNILRKMELQDPRELRDYFVRRARE